MKEHKHHPETEAVRAGTDLRKKNGPLVTPIYQTSTFEVTDSEQQLRATSTDMFYTRYGNPTHTVAEKAIAELEGTDAALLFASGMNAITTSALALLKSGDHVVAQRDIYGGATKFFSQWLPNLGIETTFVDTNEYDQHARAIRPNTKLLYLESPTNPLLRVVDLRHLTALARQHNLITFIDSTFATPINQRPADFGIDLVMHSGTKYFAGHSDLICGIVAGRQDLIQKIHETRTTLGGVMDPHAAWLLLRGIKTLAVRVQRQNDNALRSRAISRPARQSPARALSLRRRPPPACPGDGPDARRRRRPELRSGGHWRRCPACIGSVAAVHARAQPRRRGLTGQPAGADIARHDLGRAPPEDGSHGATDPAFGGNRKCRRPDRRPGTSPDRRSRNPATRPVILSGVIGTADFRRRQERCGADTLVRRL